MWRNSAHRTAQHRQNPAIGNAREFHLPARGPWSDFDLRHEKNSYCRDEYFARALVEVFITYLGGGVPLFSFSLVFLLLVVGSEDDILEDSDGEVRLELGTCSFHFSPRIGRGLLIGLRSWFSWLYRLLVALLSQGLERPLRWFFMRDHDTRRRYWIYQIHYSRYTWL